MASAVAGRRTTLDLDGSWGIAGKIHGGYLLSRVARAALADVADRHPHPMAVSAHFLSAPDAGAADLDVELLRSGRRVSALRARLTQGETLCAEVLLTAGTLPPVEQPLFAAGDGVPDLPPVEECVHAPAERFDGVRVGHLDYVDLHIAPSTAGWAQGRPERLGEIRAWLRPSSGDPADAFWLLIAGDALPPVTFNFGLMGWVPTLAYDVQVRTLPAPGWLRAVQRAQLVSDNWLDETCDVYDSRGRLVVSARQFAGYREG